MVPDPYKALGLQHEATRAQIKTAYRSLARQYHPDRLVNASALQKQKASNEFPAAAAAYQLLSDERRKRDYDHIYKFGGYDEDTENTRPPAMTTGGRFARPAQPSDPATKSASQPFPEKSKQKHMGIGYSVSDPLTYLFPSYTTCGKKSCAGITIPARLSLSHSVRFAVSSGEFTTHPNGTKQFVSQTTQFVHGKKYTRATTTLIHPNGEKQEILGAADPAASFAAIRRPLNSLPKSNSFADDVTYVPPESNDPWYVNAWNGIREKLTMCQNPCGVIMAQ